MKVVVVTDKNHINIEGKELNVINKGDLLVIYDHDPTNTLAVFNNWKYWKLVEE